MWVVFVGVVIHVIFFMSIFDIYFTSPIVHGMTPTTSPLAPPARRLVLLIADGLRADAFYEKNELCPYLRGIIEEQGVWGVSHTRVPTETRPGHVALIAGLYEDPSAIAKGWKENPVIFDSIFNQSQETWAWGSPDVLPMFSKGVSSHHMSMEMYDAVEQDFSGKDNPSRLDTWVFDRVKKFLQEAQSNDDLLQRLHQDKIIFFLHLLGLDTCGHTFKPYSKKCEENLKLVDYGVSQIVQVFEDFYKYDNKTAFIFTSDHGMTDWGSHGSGDASETMTPVVAWGAGVSGPRPALPRTMPASPSSWGLSHLARRDVNQADIAPLMASLIGIPIPINNVGVLPKEFFNISEHKLAEVVFANARQIAAHYSYKRRMIEENSLQFLYQPFPSFSYLNEEELIEEIRSNIFGGRYREAVALSEVLMKTCLSGLTYYETYYQALLLTCVTSSFLGWICWLLSSILVQPTTKHKKYDNLKQVLEGGIVINVFFFALCTGVVYIVWFQRMPGQMFIYCTLPVIVWWTNARQNSLLVFTITYFKETRASIWIVLGRVILCLIGVEILVLAFFWRTILSVTILVFALWPVIFYRHHIPFKLLLAWVFSCLGVAIFPALPVLGKEANYQLVYLAGVLCLGLSCAAIVFMYLLQGLQKRTVYVLSLLVFCLMLSLWNVASVEHSILSQQGLPIFNQILSWVLTGLIFVLPLMSTKQMFSRLFSLGLALFVPFLMMSAYHEPLFFMALALHMLCWVMLESQLATVPITTPLLKLDLQSSKDEWPDPVNKVSSVDFRRAYFFLFYIIFSFFGTGNVASVNSFDPTWLRCFVTVFSPFIMTGLVLLKQMIPVFLVTCVFRAQNIILKVPANRLFLVMVVFCDLLGVHFLHLVTNKGSWLEIGTSISHFVIVQANTMFLLLLYWVAQLYTGVQLFSAPPSNTSSEISLESGTDTSPVTKNYLLDVCFTLPNVSYRKRHFE